MIFLKNSDNCKLYYIFNVLKIYMFVKEKCWLCMSYENVDPVQEGDTVNLFVITLLLP